MAPTMASAWAASDVATPIRPANSSTPKRSVSATGSTENAPARRASSRWRGELVPRLITAKPAGDAGGQPQPAQLVLLGERLVAERAQRDRQRRCRRRVSLAGEQSERVQQQIAGARGGRPVGGQNGCRDFTRIARPDQALRREGSRERLETRLAREPRVQRFEPLGRLEQQRRSVAAAGRREGDLRPQQLGAGSLGIVQSSGLRDPPAAAPPRRSRRPGACSLRRGVHAARVASDRASARRHARETRRPPPRRLAPALGRLSAPVRRRCPRRASSSRAQGARRGDQDRHRHRSPRPARGERAGAPAAPPRCSSPNARAGDRTAPAPRNRPASGSRRRGRVRRDAELGGCPPHQHRIPHRLCRSNEQQQPLSPATAAPAAL